MLQWFSFSGILKEIKRIRWSNRKKLTEDSIKVIGFVAIFVIFFVGCTLFNAALLKLLGV